MKHIAAAICLLAIVLLTDSILRYQRAAHWTRLDDTRYLETTKGRIVSIGVQQYEMNLDAMTYTRKMMLNQPPTPAAASEP